MRTSMLSLLKGFSGILGLITPRSGSASLHIFPPSRVRCHSARYHSPSFPRNCDHELGLVIHLCRGTPISYHDTSILAA
jgi:hypothetical protein